MSNGLNKKIYLFLLLIYLSQQLIFAQQAQLSLPQFTACSNEQISVPIQVTNLYDVGAVSLYIGYDTALLDYIGHTNVHPQFTGMLTNAMVTPQTQVGLSWSSVNPANIDNGVMIELQFQFKSGDAILNFMPGGEIATTELEPIEYSTTDGMVYLGLPDIIAQPESIEATEGNQISFFVGAEGADTYQWQILDDGDWINLQNDGTYQNVQSDQLLINDISLAMDNSWYRCFLTADAGCEIYSDSAMLTVLPLQSVQLSLPYLSACYDDVLAVPLQTVGMQNIVEFEINIAYDPEVATFNGLDNVNPLIQDITYTIHSSPVHHVSISWASAAPVSLTDGMVFEMLMQYATGTTSLDFLSSSLVMGEEGISYDLFFQNGEIDAYPHPHIVSQPVAQTVYENGNAEFSVQAQNANGYQWYTFNNGNWEPLMDGGNYSGAETPNLLISEVSPDFNQKLYKCYVSGTFCSLFSEEAMLTVLPMPEVGLSLPDTLACPESVISIPLQAEGLDEITAFGILISFDPDVAAFVQLDNLHPLIATTSATVHNEPVHHVLLSWSGEQSISLPDGNILNLVFEFEEGSSPLSFLSDSFVLNADQMAFDLTLNDGEINTQLHPVITSQPQNKTVSVGGLAQFQVQASNAISYQWLESQDNGDTWQNLSDTGPYGGSQTSVLTISPVDLGLDQNQYRCMVYGDWCEAETASVTLTVLPEMSAFLMLPDTASCLDEQISIPLYGAGLEQVLSFEIYLTFESDVVEFIEIIDIHPLLEGIEASLQTSPETQLLLSWEGNEPVSLPDGDIFKLQFVYAEGATALTFMDQTMILNEALSPFVLTTLDGQISSHEYPEIVAQPQNQITYIGASAQFEVQADNALTYQWFVSDDMGNSWDTVEEGTNYSGSQSATLSILNANLSMDQTMYRCFVSAAFCGLYTNVAGLTVLPEIYAELTIDHVSACPGESVNIPIKGEGLYDVSEFGIFIAYDPMVAEFVEIVNPHPLIGDLEFVIQGQPNPQIIITWSGDATVELPDGDLFELRFNYADGEMALNLLEESYALSEELLPYNFLLFNGSLTPFPVPTIVAQPQDVIVEEGGEAVFSISAEDVLHFQWFESRDNGGSWLEVADNDMYAGSQTEVLTIVPVELSFDQYQYKCLLMGEFCDLYSSEAKLTVDTLTFIIERQLDQSARPDLLAASLYGNTLSLNFADPFTGRLHYRLFDLIGRILCENEYEVFNQTEIRIDMNHCQLKNQIYLLQGMLMDSNGMHHAISSKILNTGY